MPPVRGTRRPQIMFRLPPELHEKAEKEAKEQKIGLNDYGRTMAIRGMTVGADDSQYEYLAKQLVNAVTMIQRLSVRLCELDDINTSKDLAMQDAAENILNPARQDALAILSKSGIIKD